MCHSQKESWASTDPNGLHEETSPDSFTVSFHLEVCEVTMCFVPADPPTITESKSNEAATGRQALLRCEASAVPTPDFEWYRDDTR